MRFWERLSRKFSRGTVEGQLVLSTAYREVFLGNASRSQQQMVLSDLQARCGWTRVSDPKFASDRDIWFAEGKRAAYGEIFNHLSLSSDDMMALDNAARHETIDINNYPDA